MRSWTLHLPPEGAAKGPVLLREGFSWGAFLFGPFWLWWHRCWLAGLAAFLLLVALNFVPGSMGLALVLAAHILLGLHGRDLRRWTMERRGWRLSHVVLAKDEESALARLFRKAPAVAALWR
ncbi:DUF2628 domain-containing protein [Sabulicella glaciei]|uniref:DUF2628 domain-containing protein n=1 Tax=Sabulicella glaciei TaxID=2984948 RepID=A0ABT3NWV7_9PROT|nr:DUF2628 domain-containing protein [Roseococcus sp. MDT2-1-1]MCW8086658.1 DUF2628 domain-containing protein [Roseococcus sp. MDT2-1-1]